MEDQNAGEAGKTSHGRPARVSEVADSLAARAKSGDDLAMGELTRRLGGALSGLFRRDLGVAQQEAEALAQEAVSEALEALVSGRYDPKRSRFLTFVYGVSHVVKLRFLRQSGRTQPTPFSQLEGPVPESIRGDPEVLLPFDQIEAFLDCLRSEGRHYSLTPEERFVIIGRAQSKRFRTLATELGRSLSTVHDRAAKAIQKLRRCMESKGFR